MTPTMTVFAALAAIGFGLVFSGWQLMRTADPVRARRSVWLPAPLRRAALALGLAPTPRPRTLPRIDLPENVARRFVERLTHYDVADLVDGVAVNARWSEIGWTMVVDGGFVHAYGDSEKSLELLERDLVAYIKSGRRKERRPDDERAERDWRGGR